MNKKSVNGAILFTSKRMADEGNGSYTSALIAAGSL